MTVDVLFVSTSNFAKSYQELSADFSAVEPPTWALLLAQSVRVVGLVPKILDMNAERLSIEMAVEKIKQCSVRLICLVVYGQNPNSGTVNMYGAVRLADSLKAANCRTPISAVGSHISALPLEVLRTESSIDFVLCNEGVYALRNVLAVDLADTSTWKDVKGVAYRNDGNV